MYRRDLLTSGLLAARAPWLHSRALPLALIVFMMTVLGCGLRDWDRPVGKHGYWLRDPMNGVVLTDPEGAFVIRDMSTVWRAVEDDDWLLLEIGNSAQSESLPPRWMVVDMAARSDKVYATETEARAALPARLQAAPLRVPRRAGFAEIIDYLVFGTCVLFPIVFVAAVIGLVTWLARRRNRTQPAT